MNQSINETVVTANLSKKSDLELLEVLEYSQDDYNPLTIPIIKGILISRGVTQIEIDEADNKFVDITSKTKGGQTQGRLPKSSKLFYWLLTLATLAMAKYIITQLLGSSK